MTTALQQIPVEELKKLLSKETRAFIDALDDSDTSIELLQSTRKRIKEIIELLETRSAGKQIKPGQQ